MGSLCSMGTIALYPAGERTLAHGPRSTLNSSSLTTALNNCSTTSAIRSTQPAPAREPKSVRCPQCSEDIILAKDVCAPNTTDNTHGNINHHPQEKIPREVSLSLRLQATFENLDDTLRRQGADLHHIHLLMPRHVSRTPSLYSADDSGAGMETRQHLENGIAAARVSLLQEQSTAARMLSNTAQHSDADRMAAHPGHHSNLQNVHPLLYDVDDLKHLTAAVSRLLKTLQHKVTKMEDEERVLRMEKTVFEKERQELNRLRDELENERAEVGKVKENVRFDGATTAREMRAASISSSAMTGSPKTQVSSIHVCGDGRS